ncbi:ATP-grasp domain-containing protein [Nocardia sp. NPDC052566]|uniref:ATP-grasp domain-containing protein n=1 Tax=Nocardia sp. NPDC052566 TaxID=3364330 RepID=UPI0037C66E25
MIGTLVILGGADGAVSTYRRARELGYRTICVDRRQDAVARPLADAFVHASIRDPERIAAELAARQDSSPETRIVGVLSPASDTGLSAQRALAMRWRLPDPPPLPVVTASQDKSAFRAACDRLGFTGYGYVAGRPDPELSTRATALRFPVLVKPLDAQSSRGIRICVTAAEVALAARGAAHYANDGGVIVEELLSGRHYSAEAFVDRGRIAFVGVSARTLTAAPYFVTTTHRVPADLDQGPHRELRAMLDAVVAELGYARGPLTIDLLIDPDGRIHLIEMGARVGGNGLGELVEHAYGVDTVAAAIAAATGEPAAVTPTRSRAAISEVLYAERAGVLTGVHGLDAAAEVPELVQLTLFTGAGQPVRPYHTAANKLGHFVVVADRPDQAAAAAETVRATVRFDLTGAA